MKLILIVALLWSVALCEEIISEGSHLHFYSSDTDDLHDDLEDHDDEEGGYGLLKNDHGGHTESHHGSAGEVSDHGQRHHNRYDLGSHSAQGSVGSNQGNVQQYHDRGHYSREKKYGYEKAYGYDKVSKHHDKAGGGHSYGSSHSQHSQHSQHKKGAQDGQNHAHHSKHQQHGDIYKGKYGRLLNEHGYNRKNRDYHNRNRMYKKYINPINPIYKYGGFSSGIGGGIGGLRGGYGYGEAGRFPLYNRYFGKGHNFLGDNGLWRYGNYGEGYDGDLDLYVMDGDAGIPYNTYGKMNYAGEPVSLTGLGGSWGPHGYQYFVQQHDQSYRN